MAHWYWHYSGLQGGVVSTDLFQSLDLNPEGQGISDSCE